jgi:hypothetical protein
MPPKASAPARRPKGKAKKSSSGPSLSSGQGVAVDASPSVAKEQAVHTIGPFWETEEELIYRLPLDNYEPQKMIAEIEYPDIVTVMYPRPDKPRGILASADLFPAAAVKISSAKGRYENGWLAIRFRKTGGDLSSARAEHAAQWRDVDAKPFPIPIDIVPPAPAIIPASQETETRPMLDKAKSFTHAGERYYPLSIAAPVVQAPPSTLLDWIKKETKINGQPLRGYYFAPANRHFISEESIERAANRFIKWPSEEPAGAVTLGEKRDHTGYIHLAEAAREIGVHHHTLWRWTTKETKPTEQPLDVIKDPASDQLYIRQKDISALKKIVPRGGLRPGRRSPATLRPH